MPGQRRGLRHTPTRAGHRSTLLRSLTAIAAVALLQAATPTTAEAQTSADSTVVLQWTAPGDDGTTGRATSYDLRYRTANITGTDTLSWWNAATRVTGLPAPGVAGATDSMRVRGLQPVTTYYFLIRAADEVPNWSAYSNLAVKATTGDTVAPAAVSDLTITGTTGTTLALRWTAPGDDGTTGTVTSYDVRYSTSPITTANWASASTVTGEPAPLVAGTQQTFTVTGLQPSRTYYVAIRSTDNGGNLSGLSNVPSGATLDTIPPAPVHDLSYEERQPMPSDEVAWADLGPEDANHAL